MSDRNKSEKAAKAIIDDLQLRKGLRWAWDDIDEDIQQEIAVEWSDIIEDAFSGHAVTACMKRHQNIE